MPALPPSDLDHLNPVTTLRVHRNRKGWSMAELSVISGVSLGVVSRLELAENAGPVAQTILGNLIRLANTLEITPVELYPRLDEIGINDDG